MDDEILASVLGHSPLDRPAGSTADWSDVGAGIPLDRDL
jgi:hypothetical protein